jgi:DNA modification methylase
MQAPSPSQQFLFPDLDAPQPRDATASTFVDNMRLPVHRWFRYSAGFSAQWVEQVIAAEQRRKSVAVFDPFAGAGTTLLAAEKMGAASYGVEAHPFVIRLARAKLLYRTDPAQYGKHIAAMKERAARLQGETESYPRLIQTCFDRPALTELDRLRQAWELLNDGSAASQLAWLTLVSILRLVSHAGTAPWQYVLPRKQKKSPLPPDRAFEGMARTIVQDMRKSAEITGPHALLVESDARTCAGVPDAFADLVITSPPYANNYDYADATRLEMCFLGEIQGWADLQKTVRARLVRSCSQHVPERSLNLTQVLAAAELMPIHSEIAEVCGQLGKVRLEKGGKKTYHLMIASYFLDMARVWQALRRVCKEGARVCFVIGDSAPYGVYVPVVQWLSTLAKVAGFESSSFEKTRDRNIKWKNRKHRVPLCEGRLWIQG